MSRHLAQLVGVAVLVSVGSVAGASSSRPPSTQAAFGFLSGTIRLDPTSQGKPKNSYRPKHGIVHPVIKIQLVRFSPGGPGEFASEIPVGSPTYVTLTSGKTSWTYSMKVAAGSDLVLRATYMGQWTGAGTPTCDPVGSAGIRLEFGQSATRDFNLHETVLK
jgi:hypothetical protein